MPLAVFLSCVVVTLVGSSKLIEIDLQKAHHFHDKPTVCKSCAKWMWEGPHAHACATREEDLSDAEN